MIIIHFITCFMTVVLEALSKRHLKSTCEVTVKAFLYRFLRTTHTTDVVLPNGSCGFSPPCSSEIGADKVSKHRDTGGLVTSHKKCTLRSALFPHHDIMTCIVSQQMCLMVLLIISFFSGFFPPHFICPKNSSLKNYFLRLRLHVRCRAQNASHCLAISASRKRMRGG